MKSLLLTIILVFFYKSLVFSQIGKVDSVQINRKNLVFTRIIQADSLQINKINISKIQSEEFIKNFKEKNFKEAKYTLEKWENICGITEPIYRAKILLKLQTNTLIDSLNYNDLINNILKYKERYATFDFIANKVYYNDTLYIDYLPTYCIFDEFCKEFAEETISKFNINSINYLFCEVYSNENTDSVFYKIQSDDYNNIDLNNAYYKKVEKYKNWREFYISPTIGAWLPIGQLSLLGPQPEFGIMLGISKKNYIEFAMLFKYGKSKSTYYALRNNNLESTTNLYGGYLGVDFGKRFYYSKKQQLNLIAGIAYESIVVLDSNLEQDLRSVEVGTYNINFGIGYKYHFGNSFIGIKAKYNILDYTLSKIIDYKGDVITIQFSMGWIITSKYTRLKTLNY